MSHRSFLAATFIKNHQSSSENSPIPDPFHFFYHTRITWKQKHTKTTDKKHTHTPTNWPNTNPELNHQPCLENANKWICSWILSAELPNNRPEESQNSLMRP
jgi:hypothetical protein